MTDADRKLLTDAGWDRDEEPDDDGPIVTWTDPLPPGLTMGTADALRIQRARDAHAAPLRAMVGRLREALGQVEWATRNAAENRYCPWCGDDTGVDTWSDQKEHAATCPRQTALAATADVGAAWTGLVEAAERVSDAFSRNGPDRFELVDGLRAAVERVKGGRR